MLEDNKLQVLSLYRVSNAQVTGYQGYSLVRDTPDYNMWPLAQAVERRDSTSSL